MGFRPFVSRLAAELHILGYVRNTPAGVEIVAQGEPATTDDFTRRLVKDAPANAHIAEISVMANTESTTYKAFEILASVADDKTRYKYTGAVFVPTDLAICKDCSAELADPKNRRHEYPFINCTNCGPRYTIIENLPYDRASTTMKVFEMCPECAEEYKNPATSRFHAQPNACADCGAHLYINTTNGRLQDIEAVKYIAGLIDSGEIVAVRGVGGYHLICDAYNDSAVLKLRQLKLRPTKPFAVMCDDLSMLNASSEVLAAVSSPQAPIVIFDWQNAPISQHINPTSSQVGVMGAYSPIHKLILKYTTHKCIVATSGNRHDEPICYEPNDAERRLAHFTPHFLHHNRDIKTRIDDSVARFTAGELRIIRRGRGYAPFPVSIAHKSKYNIIFGAGAHLKNTIAISKGKYAFVSQHIGNLDNADTDDFYMETYIQMTRLLNCTPELAVCDLNESYFSSKFCERHASPIMRVQHHHAHLFAAMAEHNITGDVLGVIFDGAGLGSDGAIWGGEFFALTDGQLKRDRHLEYVPQPAMNTAAIYPARMAQSYLMSAGVWEQDYWGAKMGLTAEIVQLNGALINNNKTVRTSSAGRLFESVGAMVLGINKNEYEGQAAVALEAIAGTDNNVYKYGLPSRELAITPIIRQVAEDIKSGVVANVISARFHNTIATMITDNVLDMAKTYNIKRVVLAGGAFQNCRLLEQTAKLLTARSIECIIPRLIPINDGGISLGQVFYANIAPSIAL
ncbi:carbamoyltransferase [Deferribacterales bacterium]|nr:carbamoyltransferase [Deferribacterales bacterium]